MAPRRIDRGRAGGAGVDERGWGVKVSELILALGDDNVRFQNLDNDMIQLDWSRKTGGKITFGTNQTMPIRFTPTDTSCSIWVMGQVAP